MSLRRANPSNMKYNKAMQATLAMTVVVADQPSMTREKSATLRVRTRDSPPTSVKIGTQYLHASENPEHRTGKASDGLLTTVPGVR